MNKYISKVEEKNKTGNRYFPRETAKISDNLLNPCASSEIKIRYIRMCRQNSLYHRFKNSGFYILYFLCYLSIFRARVEESIRAILVGGRISHHGK